MHQESEEARSGLFVKTFGCQMNEYDSEKVATLLSSDFRTVEDPKDAEVVFINTCSVRQKGEQKAFSLLGTLKDLKRSNPALVIGVGGCVAQQEGEAIIQRNPDVDFVVGTHNLSLVPSLVRGARSGLRRQVAVDYRDEWEDLPDAFLPQEGGDNPLYSVRALVSIQRGCNKRCSFCVVPTTRGPEVSRLSEEIVREAALKVRLGAKEVVLLGQTVNSYGRDLSPRVSFDALLRKLSEIEGLKRIRFTSPHPADVKPGFIKLYGEMPQLCRHIHLPLQSGSDRILKLMNRNYRKQRFLEIVDQLKTACPDIALTSDIIVGFPTETRADFEETLDVMKQVEFASSFSFKYSVRPNTTAKEDFSEADLVDDAEAGMRLQELQAIQSNLSERINRAKVGKTLEVLVEGRNKKLSSLMRGRIPENTLTELQGGSPEPGELVLARIDRASPHGLKGTIVSSEAIDGPRK
ncbi:MAG: tRNA (N6-isopentenyl adenosine(37)-C2)-methylthiotransferase MiaB [Bdellovibrionales bacterium]|nr:tRNA (N6-isopentenyl adenosine(37)-C2)-methylthiotransferase MiaB [Bdellovibrionales bacterium]